ncbi:MAG: hypothetical protein K0U84_08350 [Actinomycetia bacterium]|nr:hypothetical protein [Actinomycetes bacterium]
MTGPPQPGLVVGIEVDESVLAALNGFREALGVECVGKPDLDLGRDFPGGDNLGDPLQVPSLRAVHASDFTFRWIDGKSCAL